MNEQFIRKCISKDSIDYALFKYKELAKTLNDIKSCDKWLGYISEHQRELEERNQIVVKKTTTPQFEYASILLSQLRKPQWQFVFFMIPIVLGSLMILFGLFKSGHRNAIGGGIALLILTFGFTAFRQRD
jgi:membrane-bound ClpP family serine protease